MTNTKKPSNFGIGVLLGAAAGALAGLFLAPKPGKELREDAKKTADDLKKRALKLQKELEGKDREEAIKYVFGKTSTEAQKTFDVVRKELSEKLAELTENSKTIDKDKYVALVKESVAKVKDHEKLKKEELDKLIKYLESDFKKLKPKKDTKGKLMADVSDLN